VTKDLGFSNVWLSNVTYPLCTVCQTLESQRKASWSVLDSEDRSPIIALVVAALAGLATFVLARAQVLGLWSFLIGLVGMVVGGLVGFWVTRTVIVSRQHRRWRLEHPQLPDLDHPAISITELTYRDRAGASHTVNAMRCQCDAYADLLSQVPFYAGLQAMVNGEPPAAG
jgi:hypothetical protein